MNLQSHRATIALFLLLFPSVQSLVTPDVLAPRISPSIGQYPKHSYSVTSRQPATTNANRRRHGLSQCPTSLHIAYPGRGSVESWGKTLSTPLSSAIRAAGLVLASAAQTTMQTIRKYWWCHPMLLALVPPYSVLFRGTYATMPDWWGVVDMGHIAASDHAHWIIAPFLGSNAAYALSGTYLMKKFGFLKLTKGAFRFYPTKFAMLGVWVVVAGLMSTIYHSVQALGSYALAENLCYLDHAIAGSATFYFLDTCGAPSKTTAFIGAIAAVTLVAATPNYAWIHSAWHYLSALTATRWALDGYKRIFTTTGGDEQEELEKA